MAGRVDAEFLSSRDPVSLGEVKGVFHASHPPPKGTNPRSSRRGKEQIKSKTSRKTKMRRSDLRVGENPWNWIRETR
jgi:hypothetical protein